MQKIITRILTALGLRGSAKAERHLSKLDGIVAALRKAEQEIYADVHGHIEAIEVKRAAHAAAEVAHEDTLDALYDSADRASRVASNLENLYS